MLNSPLGKTTKDGHYVAVIRETEDGDRWIYVNDDDSHETFPTADLNDKNVNKALGLPGDPYAFVYKRVIRQVSHHKPEPDSPPTLPPTLPPFNQLVDKVYLSTLNVNTAVKSDIFYAVKSDILYSNQKAIPSPSTTSTSKATTTEDSST
jgi:hypothetical protein